MIDNEKKSGCKYCWNELMNALDFGMNPTRCGHCGATGVKEITNDESSDTLRNGETKHLRQNNNDWKPKDKDCGLRPIVGDYWGSAIKTRKNPHGLGLDRYCGIHEMPMEEGFRKHIADGSTIFKCGDCDFQDLFPPKVKLNEKLVIKLLKPYHHRQ